MCYALDVPSAAPESLQKAARQLMRPQETVLSAFSYAEHTLRLAFLGWRTRARQRQVRTLGVMPHRPLPPYTLWAIAQILGLELVSKPTDSTILFVDSTYADQRVSTWINGKCIDVSKTAVADAFTQISGRELAVDPRTHHGPMLEKSEYNGLHKGAIVVGPVAAPKAGFVYQRLIDNTMGDGEEVEDLRACIVGNSMPLVYRKHRSIAKRFDGTSERTTFVDPDDVFSTGEQQMVLDVCARLGLDFGDVDVLRDRHSGELFVVDVNKTSIAPPIHLPYNERTQALRVLAAAFKREFLD